MRTIIAGFRLLLSRTPGKNFFYLPIESTGFGLGHHLIKALCKFMEGIFGISARLFGGMPTEKLLCVKYDSFFAQVLRFTTATLSTLSGEQGRAQQRLNIHSCHSSIDRGKNEFAITNRGISGKFFQINRNYAATD